MLFRSNIYATGTYQNPDLGNTVKAYLRKISPAGAILWQIAAPISSPNSDINSNTGESLALDPSNNVYWLVNVFGNTYNGWQVSSIDPATGDEIWNTQQYQYSEGGMDITVLSNGQLAITTNGYSQLAILNSDGSSDWSVAGSGQCVCDTGTLILVGDANAIVTAYEIGRAHV